MENRKCLLCLFLVLLACQATYFPCPSVGAESATFRLEPSEFGKTLFTPDGRIVFQYMIQKPKDTNLSANSTCCLYPLNSPKGIRVVDLAPGDHRHHRGVFLAWHAMQFDQRADFWGWGEMAPTENRKIVNRELHLVDAERDYAKILAKNDWKIADRTVLQEECVLTVREKNATFVIDFDFRLVPTENMIIDRSAFGGFCVKSRQDGKPTFFDPQGEVHLSPPHHLKPDTDWPNASFYDYTFTLDSGTTAGIAVMSYPDNPPTRWHNLLSIAMINPCIVATGSVPIKKGESLSLKYQLIVHDGPRPKSFPPLSGK